MDDVNAPVPESSVLDDVLSSASTKSAVSSASTTSASDSSEVGSEGLEPVVEASPQEEGVGVISGIGDERIEESSGILEEEELPPPTVADDSSKPQPSVLPTSRWVDDLEKVEAPTQQPQQIVMSSRRGVLPPPDPVRRSPPEAPEPSKIVFGPPFRLDVLEQKVRQVEDVMSRFQLLLDVREQAIGRLDDETQRLSAFQGKSKSIVNELRTQMSAMMKVVGQLAGPDRLASALREESTQMQGRSDNAFRGKPDTARFSKQPGGHDGFSKQPGGHDGFSKQPGGHDGFSRQGGVSNGDSARVRQGGGGGPDYGAQQWQPGGRGGRGRTPGGNGYARNGGGGRRVYDSSQ